MDRLGIELLSVFGLAPVEYVKLASRLGCAYIAMGSRDASTGVGDEAFNPHNYPHWTMHDNPSLKRDMLAAMDDYGVSVSLIEGFIIAPGIDVSEYGQELDFTLEMGARRINCASAEPDRDRAFDQVAKLAEMADLVGIEMEYEFAPILATQNLEEALTILRYAGRPNAKLLVDTMHFFRSGATIGDLANIDPSLIGYIQMSDVPLISPVENYMEEAVFGRLAPGAGELPLVEILSALPRDIPIGLEIPQRDLALAGVGPYDRLKPCVEGARAVLAKVE